MTNSIRSRRLSVGFLVVLLGFSAAGYRVARAAEDAILASRSGSISQFTLDPSAPGFRAFTEPTPTALVVHTAVAVTGGAELVGLTVLTAAKDDAGGTVVTIPRTFVNQMGSGTALSELFVTDGLDAVTAEIRHALGIGFGEVIVLDASSWTTLMQADLPLDLTLRDDLVVDTPGDGEDRLVLAAGTRAFNLAEIARIAAHRNPAEPALGVALRHQQIWQSWISRTAALDERPELFDVQSGFVTLIGSLASAEVAYQVIPSRTEPADDPAQTRYLGDDEAIARLVAKIVPFPKPAEPGALPGVLLLDATFGGADGSPFVEAVVLAGGRVTILGNTDSGSQAITEVQVHEPGARSVGDEIAALLEIGPARSVPLDDATTAITVVIGVDSAESQ